MPPCQQAPSLLMSPLRAGGRAELCRRSAQEGEVQLLHCTTAPFAIALQSLLFPVPSALQTQQGRFTDPFLALCAPK